MDKAQGNIGLFVSCLVDLTRPQTGFSALNILQKAGFDVSVPEQSCCGQPAYNNGHKQQAKDIAKATIHTFEGYDYTIVPSSSCAGMIKHHIPSLLKDEPNWQNRAANLAKKTYELTNFLTTIAEIKTVNTVFNGRIYYHESCSSRREMPASGARDLLASIKGAEVIDFGDNATCCGFGGLFSVKFPVISEAMVQNKLHGLDRGEHALLTGPDLGCLLHIASKLQQEGYAIKAYHLAEVLNGTLDAGAIAEPKR